MKVKVCAHCGQRLEQSKMVEPEWEEVEVKGWRIPVTPAVLSPEEWAAVVAREVLEMKETDERK